MSSPTPAERRAAASSCAWCGNLIQPKARGRIPTWCSSACRRRAWDQKLAATSGRSAVEVVERLVEVPVPAAPGRRDWPRLLGELTRQLEDGRIYDRDLAALAEALLAATDACGRRGGTAAGHPPRPALTTPHGRRRSARPPAG
jgi:hypothetical protein